MKKGLTELIFILDRSGSMHGLEKDTIGGFNSLIEKQKKEDGEAIVSTVLFDNFSSVIHDRVDLKDIKPMTEEDYYTKGCTALLDAIGGAINHIKNIHKYAREEDIPEKTLFIITTDGYENSSRCYSFREIKRLISMEKEKYGWEFLFLGANIDAAAAAEQYGIDRSRAVNYRSDSRGTSLNYAVLSKTVSGVRRSRHKNARDAFNLEKELNKWSTEIDADFNSRS